MFSNVGCENVSYLKFSFVVAATPLKLRQKIERKKRANTEPQESMRALWGTSALKSALIAHSVK